MLITNIAKNTKENARKNNMIECNHNLKLELLLILKKLQACKIRICNKIANLLD